MLQLIAIFMVLLLAVVAVQISKNKKGERSFKAELLEFDIENVTSLSLKGQQAGKLGLNINLENEKWHIQTNDKSYNADADLINSMLNELAGLKAIQKVAAKKEKWANFDVTDSAGVHVTVKSDSKVLGDLFIGRFSYNQNTRKPKTFVRLNKEKDVFAVEGYLSMTFNRDLNGLRDKSIFRGNSKDFTKITLTYPADSSFTLTREANGWTINGQAADSVETSKYLGSLAYLTGSEFMDDLEPSALSSVPYLITIEGNDLPIVEIKATPREDGRIALISTVNPDSVFNGTSGNLFDKIFVGPGKFQPVLKNE